MVAKLWKEHGVFSCGQHSTALRMGSDLVCCHANSSEGQCDLRGIYDGAQATVMMNLEAAQRSGEQKALWARLALDSGRSRSQLWRGSLRNPARQSVKSLPVLAEEESS